MSSLPFGRAEFRIILDVNGREYEIAQAESDFALNTIPMANCSLAVGREVRSLQAAKIHAEGHQLSTMKPASIYLEARGKHSPSEDWPEGRQRVFQGYLTGQGYRKAFGNAQMTLSLVHWLADMQFSTALSESSHPSNHQEYTFRASTETADEGGNSTGLASILAQYRAETLFDTGNISTDLFAKSILPFFQELCRADTMLLAGNRSQCFGSDIGKKNDLALAALAKFETTRAWNVPLSLALGGAATSLAEGIRQTIVGRLLTDADFFQSLWDVLIGKLAPMFMFGVVPRVDNALVAPIIAGLRPLYERRVYDTDQDFVDLSGAIPRPLRGVGIYGSRADGTVAKMTENDLAPDPEAGLGGCYIPTPKDGSAPRGMILIKAAPPWLANVASCALDVQDSLGAASATTPGGGAKKSEPTPSARVREAVDVYGDYAKAMYIQEALRGRQGMVTGKLRFDISPGSNIWIEGNSEKFIGESDKLGQNLVGMVMRSTFGLNSEQAKASTGYQLGYVRTEEENDDDQLSVETHPLYKGAFKGAPLVDGFGFA